MVSLQIDICISKGHSHKYNEHYEKPQIQQDFFLQILQKHRMTGKMCLINEYDSPRDVQSALPTSPWSNKKELMLIIQNVN